MDQPFTIDAVVRPWRTATLVASAIAALELVALLGAGIVLLGRPLAHHVRRAAEAHALAPVRPHRPAPARSLPVGTPRLARGETSVLVLNGSGRQGAAADAAQRVSRLGYIVGGVGNAPRPGDSRSAVMYRKGYRPEAARLAHDLHLRIVVPLDGLSPKQLLGAHLALVVGA